MKFLAAPNAVVAALVLLICNSLSYQLAYDASSGLCADHELQWVLTAHLLFLEPLR